MNFDPDQQDLLARNLVRQTNGLAKECMNSPCCDCVGGRSMGAIMKAYNEKNNKHNQNGRGGQSGGNGGGRGGRGGGRGQGRGKKPYQDKRQNVSKSGGRSNSNQKNDSTTQAKSGSQDRKFKLI